MVSIPDWSRFGHLGEVQKESPSLAARYNKQREAEAIKQAEESGYFLSVTRKYIEKNILGVTKEEDERRQRARSFLDEEQEIDLGGITLINLVNSRLRHVGDIGLCPNLRICVLNSNFLTRFDALVTCTHLIKLDLHSNQIQTVPTSAFWASMSELKILNLHDNPIGKIENLHNLAACPRLLALTLYDTPLSLKRNYRHHVVNSIWSLKALDAYVISDEEIIEDAEFGGRFATLHPNFAINVCQPLPQDAAFEEELRSVYDVMSDINLILAHSSPVLLIQRYVRGYLTRKHFKFVADTRTWAATTIQRKYRDWKSSDTSQDGAPPSSPLDPTKAINNRAQNEATRLDYDTYMKHRRPGSTVMSETSALSARQMSTQQDQLDEKDTTMTEPDDAQVSHRFPGTPIASENGDGKKHIFINLAKLELGTLQSLHDEAIAMEALGLPSAEWVQGSTDQKLTPQVSQRQPKKRKKDAEKKRTAIKSVRQFFGPVVQTKRSPEPSGGETDEEEIPVVNFRLKGYRQHVEYYDPTVDMIVAKQEAGRIVRAAENNYHREIDMRPEPVIQQKSQPNAEKRLFNRIQGTMGFSCLRAVEQAYKDRSKAEKQVAKMEYVLNMKDQREAAKERIRLYQDDRRNKSLKDREKEQKKIIEILEKRELQRLGYLDKTLEIHNKSSHYTRHRRGELTFISDFNAQNTSVSNALLRHDRQARKEDKLQERADVVQNNKATDQEQKDVVKKYLEHRQLMRQTESALARAALDTRMLQEANDRLMDAKQRVAHQNATNKRVEALCPLPSTSQTFLPNIDGPSDKYGKSVKGLDRWGASVLLTAPQAKAVGTAE